MFVHNMLMGINENLRKKLSEIIQERGLDYKNLSLSSGLSETFVRDFLKGRARSVKIDSAENLANALNISLFELIGEKKNIPVVGYVSAGSGIDLIDNYQNGGAEFYIECPPDLVSQEYAAVQIKGESMSPHYPVDSILIFRRDIHGLDDRAINRPSIICTADNRAMFKYLSRGNQEGTFDLTSLNPLFPPEYGVKITWAAPMKRFLFPEDVKRTE